MNFSSGDDEDIAGREIYLLVFEDESARAANDYVHLVLRMRCLAIVIFRCEEFKRHRALLPRGDIPNSLRPLAGSGQRQFREQSCEGYFHRLSLAPESRGGRFALIDCGKDDARSGCIV